MKDKLIEIVERIRLADKRAAKFTVDDMVKLLSAFNAEGVHFTTTRSGEPSATSLDLSVLADEDQ